MYYQKMKYKVGKNFRIEIYLRSVYVKENQIIKDLAILAAINRIIDDMIGDRAKFAEKKDTIAFTFLEKIMASLHPYIYKAKVIYKWNTYKIEK